MTLPVVVFVHDLKPEKGENMEIKDILHKYPSNRWFRNEIYSLLSRANSTGSADIIYRMCRISLFCKSGIVFDVKK